MTADQLIARPNSRETGQAILDWIAKLRGRILSGEMMIGILSVSEVEKAPIALRKAADCGLAAGWLELGSWLANPPFGAPKMVEALSALRQAVSLGVPGADLQFVRVVWFYGRDEATEAEKREAYELAKGAVTRNQDDAAGVHLLGLLTCQGFGVPADAAGAVRLQENAATLGSADALFELFVHHQTGLGVEPNERTALEFLQRAAEAGHPRAMYNMGAMSATGRGFWRDPAAAVKWYTRASDAGNHRATAALAVMYAKGDGVTKDLEQAGQLFDLAEYMGVDVAALRDAVGLPREPEGEKS